MADFDERAIRSPDQPVETIRTDDLRPWMVWTAAAAIGALALLGLYSGIRGGHPASGVSLTLANGAALDPASAASASSAVALPRDQSWSTLSGPAVLPPSAAVSKTAAADEADSGEEASDTPAAAAATAEQPEAAPVTVGAPVSASPATPPPTPDSSDNPANY